MDRPDRLTALTEAIVDLNEESTLRLAVELAADETIPRRHILQACQEAMRLVGERYERHEYYLAGLILAGELFTEVVDLIQPRDEAEQLMDPVGTVVLGTVAGDIHDIGKNMFATALRTSGFAVFDLGVDVSPARFLEETARVKPGVVCLSGLITPAFTNMKATVDLLRAEESRLGYHPRVVIGGGTVDETVRAFVGADSWSCEALEGVRICRRLLGLKDRA
jgi:methanogenic corrinoid protein MtbC1